MSNSKQLNINGTDDPFYRYKMPRIETRENAGRKRTYWKNLEIISEKIARDRGFVSKFFNKKLSTSVNWKQKDDELEIGGIYKVSDLQSTLQEMINNYVLCKDCGNPETKLRLKSDGKRMSMKCAACGKKSVLDYNGDIFESLIKYLKSSEKEQKKKKKI